MSGKMDGFDHVAVKAVLSPDEHAIPEFRHYSEDRARQQFAAFIRDNGYALLDSPVGRWERVEQEFGEDDVRVRWEYRLHGWAKPKKAVDA